MCYMSTNIITHLELSVMNNHEDWQDHAGPRSSVDQSWVATSQHCHKEPANSKLGVIGDLLHKATFKVRFVEEFIDCHT